jgi:hypothetical protein
MSQFYICPYLNGAVELTEERLQHIIDRHPGTLPDYQEQLAITLRRPDQIRQGSRSENTLLFTKWFDTIRTGRYLVVVTVSDDSPKRDWIITMYTARRLSGGDVIWPVDS